MKPHRFFWILPAELAAMAKPGLLNPVENDLGFLKENGITHLFTLLENPLPEELFRGTGLSNIHLPVDDFGVPRLEQVEDFCRQVRDIHTLGGASAVHCHAGMGRTGIFVASYLAYRNQWDGITAIRRSREISPEYIQTSEQEHVVVAWAERNTD